MRRSGREYTSNPYHNSISRDHLRDFAYSRAIHRGRQTRNPPPEVDSDDSDEEYEAQKELETLKAELREIKALEAAKPSPAELKLAEVAARLDKLAKRAVAAEMDSVEAAAEGAAAAAMGTGAEPSGAASSSPGFRAAAAAAGASSPSPSKKFKPTEAVASMKARFEEVSAKAKLADRERERAE